MGVFEKEQEELLSYDANAFFYFAATMLLVTLTPWTYYTVKRIVWPKPPEEINFDSAGPLAQKGTKPRRCTSSAMEAKHQRSLEVTRDLNSRVGGLGGGLRLVALIFLWICFAMVMTRVQDTDTQIRSFDPHKILGIDRSADEKQIKKAYRKRSLETHPDKDKDNPLAHVQFQQVSKAYASLTDETARKNYEKYGNPDGPVNTKVGIALHPALLVSKEAQRTTLLIFFFVLFIVPFSLVCCCLRGAKMAHQGVCGETLGIYHAVLNAQVQPADVAGLVCASMECRQVPSADMLVLAKAMVQRSPPAMEPGVLCNIGGSSEFAGRRGVLDHQVSENVWEVEVWPELLVPTSKDQCVKKELPAKDLSCAEPRIDCCFSDAPIRRKAALLWAHVWRLHAHMTKDVQDECTALLRHAERLGRALVSIAAHGQGDRSGFLECIRSIMHYRRCLVQAIEVDASPLLQIPYVKSAPPKGAPTLKEVIEEGSAHPFIKSLNLTEAQKLDVDSFCRHMPRVKLDYHVEVPDEENIAEGDMATLTVRMTRKNLTEGEAAGPVHAPLWPCPKFEEWWILVYDDSSRRLVTADLVLGPGRTEDLDIRFMVPRGGEFRWKLFAMCDSYAGIDVECPVTFTALKKNEINREIFVHPQDVNIKSFFEELMLGLEEPQDDSDSEDEAPKAVEAKPEEPEPPKPEKKAATDSDSDDDTENAPEGTFYKILNPGGAYVYREPNEEPESRVGSIAAGTILRGHTEEDATALGLPGGSWPGGWPKGWMIMAGGGGAWIRIDGCAEAAVVAKEKGEDPLKGGPNAKALGPLCEQDLRTVVQTSTPIALVKRWMKTAKASVADLGVQDMFMVRDIEDLRARMLVEELVRKKMGNAKFEELIGEVEKLRLAKQQRLTKALGFFSSANGIVWHVHGNGAVQGLHQDGNRIRDRVEISSDDKISIGPFALDESKTCSCIHWLRKDDPSKAWVWSRDLTLRSRIRLGQAF